jgi:hypothetical protein
MSPIPEARSVIPTARRRWRIRSTFRRPGRPRRAGARSRYTTGATPASAAATIFLTHTTSRKIVFVGMICPGRRRRPRNAARCRQARTAIAGPYPSPAGRRPEHGLRACRSSGSWCARVWRGRWGIAGHGCGADAGRRNWCLALGALERDPPRSIAGAKWAGAALTARPVAHDERSVMSKRNGSRDRDRGITERHARACASNRGAECDCTPTFKCQVWDARAGKRLTRTSRRSPGHGSGARTPAPRSGRAR